MIFLSYFAAACGVHAQEIRIVILKAPRYILPGVPGLVDVRFGNASGKELQLPCRGARAKLGYEVTRPDGAKVVLPVGISPGTLQAGLGDKALQRGWVKEIRGFELLVQKEEAGQSLRLQFQFDSGKCLDMPGQENAGIGLAVYRSTPIIIPVIKLEGEDLAAYELYTSSTDYSANRRKVIEQFPASLYAGSFFKYLGGELDVTFRNPEDLIRCAKGQALMDRTHVAPEVCRRGTARRREAESLSARRTGVLTAFLSKHPDVDEREQIELMLAKYALFAGDLAGARSAYEWLAANAADSKTRESAGRKLNQLGAP